MEQHRSRSLSDRLWRERYGADPNMVGRSIEIDSEDFTIIGVMPRGFQFLGVPVDVWRSRIVDTRTLAPASVQLGASSRRKRFPRVVQHSHLFSI